jgi:hypothetical protein
MASVAGQPASAQSRPHRLAQPSRATWLERAIAFVERRRLWALAVLLVLAGLLLLYMGRGLTFYYDDWDFVTHDYGGGVHSLLVAHVGNISIFPIAVYKVLFHLVGLNHYAVFRLVVIALHLIVGGLVYLLASRRVEPVPALLASALVLFLGAAWEDLLWAFQVGYLLSIVGGLAAWLLLERHDRAGDVLATIALVVSIGSSSLGIPLVLGAACELAWRKDWRRGWIVVVPAVLYAAWYLGYGESQITGESLINAPGFAADLAASAVGGLAGHGLEWGRPLALLAFVVVLWRLTRPGPIAPRLVGALATVALLWIVTAVTRSTTSAPETSRYIYLGAVAVVLIGVELARGTHVSPRVTAAATVVVAACAITGLTAMRNGARGLRTTSKPLTAELGALELASSYAPPTYQPDVQRAPQIVAGPYLHTVRAIGSSPGDSPAEILAAEPGSRNAADAVLLAAGAAHLTPVARVTHAALAPAPYVVALTSGTQVQKGSCVQLVPAPGSAMGAILVLPHGGVGIGDHGVAEASLAYRRFGEAFDPSPVTVAPHSETELTFAADAATVPWQLQVSSTSPLVLCGLQP